LLHREKRGGKKRKNNQKPQNKNLTENPTQWSFIPFLSSPLTDPFSNYLTPFSTAGLSKPRKQADSDEK